MEGGVKGSNRHRLDTISLLPFPGAVEEPDIKFVEDSSRIGKGSTWWTHGEVLLLKNRFERLFYEFLMIKKE